MLLSFVSVFSTKIFLSERISKVRKLFVHLYQPLHSLSAFAIINSEIPSDLILVFMLASVTKIYSCF
jgi:hypothetical protein